MQNMIQNKVVAWLRGLVWAAMIGGCAWASGQNYLVQPPSGNYHAIALGHGEGLGLGQGMGKGEGAQSTQPLSKDDLFAGTEVFAKGASDITEITMDPDSLGLVGGPDRGRARNTVLQVVRTYTYDKPGMYNMADVDAIRNKLNTGDWHCSVHVRDLKNGTGSDVCNKRRTDGMKETAIIEVEQKQLTFIHTIRREGGPGASELGYYPMLPGLSGLPALAMMDPEGFADMQIAIHSMPLIMGSGMPFVYSFNSENMRDLKSLKDLKVKPFTDDQLKQMKHFRIDVQPDDATPQAAPAPGAPPTATTPETAPTPQVAPTPETPQTAPTPQAPQ